MFFKMNFNASVGALTENKARKVKALLKEGFPDGMANSNQIIASGDNKQIILTEYGVEYLNNLGDYNNDIALIKSLFDLLMLDENISDITILLADILSDKEYSMSYIQDKFIKLTEDSIGLGLRSFFEYNNSLCEFKIEPYLSDSKKMYVEGIYFEHNVNINNIESVIKNINDDYNVKKENLKI